MSQSIYLLRFVGGEVAPLDRELFRRVAGPYMVGGGPAAGGGSADLQAEDGGGASVFFNGEPDELEFVSFVHLGAGAMVGVLARIADALGAAIVIPGGAPLIFHEDRRRHLPAELREEALVVAPTAVGVAEGFDRC